MSFVAESSKVATPNQRGLWLLDRLAPLTNTYNLARSVTLVGPLDDGALRKAFRAMVRRHEVLRTRFADVDDEPVPLVASAPEFVLQVEDLSGLAHDQQEARADALTRREARTPFDLSEGPLLRGRLLRLAAQKHRLLVTLHHIIADDASLAVFWRELAALYEASVLGLPSPLPRLPMQFSDHAQRQHARLSSAEMRQQLAYWKQMLKDPPVLALPVDHSRPGLPSYRGHLARFSLPAELTRDLRALSRTHGATMFTTLLAALQVLLYRYCGQEDIQIGVPVRGRNEPELMGLIGYFVNMLVIRADLSGAPTFAEHLARARARTTAAYAHQDVPFDVLVKELAERRDASRNPLFQVLLTQWSTESAVLRLAGLEAADIVAVDTGSAMFDLSLTVLEQAGQCHFSIEYAADLFDASSIDRMTGHFKTLLEGIVAHPDMPIGDIPLLTEEERHLLLVEWNDTQVLYPADHAPAMRFEAQVRRTPDAVALIHEDQRLSYAQLNAQANRLATHLRDRVGGPDVPVAICMERSFDSLVGILAVLKVGATYVPIDPQHPDDRIAFMLDDARAKVVLVHEATRHRFASTDPRIVCVHADQEAIARCDGDDVSTPRDADALAYVIYTSGSTGVPKGVQIAQRGLCNHVSWISERLQLGPGDRVLHSTSISFDASVWEMVAPLCVGASLSLARPGGERDMAYLARVLHDEHLTVLQVVPSMLRALLKEPQLQGCSDLRYIVCGGEPLDYELVGRLQRLLPRVRLGNFYGPTETSTDATHFELDAHARGTGVVPIGRPIANTRCHVLDDRRQPVPIGVVGELHIGGTGLARGYLNRPELTAERFVADPFRPGERLYRTGDLARYLPDGVIAFVGRDDDQVKIRGFRIEPAEVGNVLAVHADVRACHVAARRQSTGEIGLTAYVVVDDLAAKPPALAELRHFLSSRLPAYMIPASFVMLATLPLSVSGKVDTQALPDPASSNAVERVEYVAPVDAVERTMCRVWAEVLRIERVGTEDNFFEIGGHSLLAARLFARLDEEFGQSPALGVLFVAPTVRLLSEHYRDVAAPGDGQPHALVALRVEGTKPPLYFVPGIFGNVVGYADLVRELGPERPIYGLQCIGLTGQAEPFDSIAAMASFYLRELRVCQPGGPYHVIGVCFGATVAYEMTRQLLATGETVAFLGLISPTAHEAAEGDEHALSTPRVVKRGLAFGNLIRERLRVYLAEMKGLGVLGRLGYLVRKTRSLGETAVRPRAFRGALRELNQIEVYRANVHALDTFVRQPLEGRLGALEIFNAADAQPAKVREPIRWESYWHGPIKRHVLAGTDSGDMLSGANARAIAQLLIERLHAEPARPLNGG